LATHKLKAELAALKQDPPPTIDRLLGVEGRAAYAYFDAWRTCPIRWKGIDRKPVPDDWHQIGRRASKAGQFRVNRNATHPVNAMLNYGYAVLESQIRMDVVAAGLDPTMGVIHGRSRGQQGLVLDLMEPQRPIVDRKVLEFVQAHTFHPADFTMRSDGVCRLNPQLALSVVMIVINALRS
jgi:CRISPR-associated endonuclease Cas1